LGTLYVFRVLSPPASEHRSIWILGRFPRGIICVTHLQVRDALLRGVVAQVEFERHILKPGLIFKGKGLKPGAFRALWVI
jgi:hypothetical protein